jgi:glycogen debranching enzyme
VSRGCFAQAWSVTELLRAVYDYEKMQEEILSDGKNIRD